MTFYAVALFLSALVAALIAWLAWRRRDTPGAMPLAVLMLACAEWATAYALHWANAPRLYPFLYLDATYVGIVAVPAALVAFALEFTFRPRWLTRRNLALLTCEPVLTLAFLWTDDAHGLFFGDKRAATAILDGGVWFWTNMAYSYVLILLAGLVLTQYMTRAARLYRGQVAMVIAGMFPPLVGSFLVLLRLTPFPELDLMPFAFTLTGVASAYGLFRYHLFDIAPIARDLVIETMGGGVLVLDARNRIVDANPAALKLIRAENQNVIGRRADQVFAEWRELAPRLRENAEADAEIQIAANPPRYLGLRITPLLDRTARRIGRVIAFRDITARKAIESETRQRLAELETIHAISLASASQLELPALLELVGARLRATFDVQGVYIALLDANENIVHIPYWVALDERLENRTIAPTQGLTGVILQSRQPLLINRDYEPASARLGVVRVPTPAGRLPKTWLGVPMLARDEAIGVLAIQNFERENVFTADDVRVLATIAANIGTALQNAQLYARVRDELRERTRAEAEVREANEILSAKLLEIETLQAKLREQAIRDTVTGLFNRRYLEETLEREIARAARQKLAVSVIMMDLDRCKNVNDSFGHKAGDMILQALGRLLLKHTRGMDVACRYGGEEFAVVLPGAPLATAAQRAEQIRAEFQALRVAHNGNVMSATLSLGVAEYPHNGVNGDQVLDAADKGLYDAKQNGRNRVAVYRWNQ